MSRIFAVVLFGVISMHCFAQNQPYNRTYFANEASIIEIEQLMKDSPNDAIIKIDELLGNSEKTGNDTLKAKMLVFKTQYFNNRGEWEKAIETGKKATQLANRIQLWYVVGVAQFHLAWSYRYTARSMDQFKSASSSVEIFRHYSDTAWAVHTLNMVGNIYNKIDGPEKSLAIYRYCERLSIEANHDYGLAESYINIGSHFLIDERSDSATYYLQKALSIYRDLEDDYLTCMSLVRLGREHTRTKRHEDAIDCFKETVERGRKIDAPLWIGRGYNWHGFVLFTQDKNDEALPLFDSAVKYLEPVGDIQILQGTYRRMSRIQGINEEYEASLHSLRRHKEIDDTLEVRKNLETVQNIEFANQLQRRENQIEFLQERELILSEKQEAEAQARIWLFIALAITIGIGFVLFQLFRQRTKLFDQEKLLRKKDRERAVQDRIHDLNLQKVHEEKLKLEIEVKNKELTTLTMQMLNRSEAISELRQELKDFEQQVIKKTDALPLVHEVRKISSKIKEEGAGEKDWEQFRLYFENVHTNFFSKLKSKHPQLTPYDLKLCAYFHMNLGNKQVANIMNISHDAVKKQRTRMRKKMNLTKEDNLLSYLATVTS